MPGLDKSPADIPGHAVTGCNYLGAMEVDINPVILIGWMKLKQLMIVLNIIIISERVDNIVLYGHME